MLGIVPIKRSLENLDKEKFGVAVSLGIGSYVIEIIVYDKQGELPSETKHIVASTTEEAQNVAEQIRKSYN
jgi:hypothetical protein